MYFEDLELCEYHPGTHDAESWDSLLLAVGWLEHPHSFPTGPTPDGLSARLLALAEQCDSVHPGATFRGLHACSICEAESGTENYLDHSHMNLFVPGDICVFVAPAGIAHYIEQHSYLPPPEFLAAVQECADVGTSRYEKALTRANCGVEPPLIRMTRMSNESRPTKRWRKRR